MITPDGWLDWADRAPGPDDKVYAAPNAAQGYVAHSAVGYRPGALERLMSDERRPDGRYTAYAAASWHLWVGYDGNVLQHYPFFSSCWHAGAAFPNCSFIGAETEGGADPYSEPLTGPQLDQHARIIRELATFFTWPEIRRPADANDRFAQLYEHNECVRWGAAPTACPSGRIPWDRLLERLDGPMTQPAVPTPRDIAYAGAAAALFAQEGRSLTDLHTYDQETLRWLARQL